MERDARISDIRPLARAETSAASQLLAHAFVDDPAFQYALPETTERARLMAWLYERVLRGAWLRGGWVDAMGHGPDAVAVWLPIDKPYSEPLITMLRAGLAWTPLVVGIPTALRLSEFGNALAALHRRHAPLPHHYLQMIAVAPAAQGRGLGSKLLAHGLARADAARRPVYLETEVARNLPLYRRNDFEVMEETESLPAVRIWSLLRQAR